MKNRSTQEAFMLCTLIKIGSWSSLSLTAFYLRSVTPGQLARFIVLV